MMELMDRQVILLTVVLLASKSLDEIVWKNAIQSSLFFQFKYIFFCHGIFVAAIISTQICIFCHICDLI